MNWDRWLLACCLFCVFILVGRGSAQSQPCDPKCREVRAYYAPDFNPKFNCALQMFKSCVTCFCKDCLCITAEPPLGSDCRESALDNMATTKAGKDCVTLSPPAGQKYVEAKAWENDKWIPDVKVWTCK